VTKLALIGDLSGPGFAALRTWHFRQLRPDAEVFDWRDSELERRVAGADAIVTAGIYGPTRAAMAVVGDRPLWLDLPGDPFADAEAAALRGQTGAPAEARRVFVPALLRADAFSSIGARARDALQGQLGMLGRDVPIAVIPVPYAFPQPEAPDRPVADVSNVSVRAAPIRIGLIGSFNTWFDEQCLADALIGLARSHPVEIRVIGGDVPGHFTAGYQNFRRVLEAAAVPVRWLPVQSEADLPAALGDAEVGVVLDRPGWEPHFGSRTRILFYLWRAMRVVATCRCEQASLLTKQGFIQEVSVGDTAGVIQALLHRRPLPDRALLRQEWDPLRLGRPLQEWVPKRRKGGEEGEVLTGLLREREHLRAELAGLRASPTWKLLDRLNRLRRAMI
jgi:hypothetical protein